MVLTASIDLLSNPLSTAQVPCIINGKPYTTSRTYARNDPHTGKHLFDVTAATEHDARAAIESAKAAFPAWKATSPIERRKIFQNAVRIIEQRKDDIIKLATHETTHSIAWTRVDIMLTIAALEELASAITQLMAEIVRPAPGQEGYIFREPFGVVLGIAPWNAALTLGFRSVSNAIIGGNTAIMKSSEHSPRVHNAVAQIFSEAGLPAGVLNVVHVDPRDAPKVVESMVAHPAIAEMCGRYLKPSVMELGGSAPFIVLEDADIEHAANNAIHASFLHSGQICMSANVLLLHESIANEFLTAMKNHVLKAGQSPDSTYRGLFTSQSADRVRSLISDALAQGASLVTGSSGLGNIIQPTILDNTPESARIVTEEIFGPAVCVIRFKDEEDAVRIANDREFGLSAAVFSKDLTRAFAIARRIESGAVHINDSTIHDCPTLPHGGWKKSGWGRFNGLEGIKEFTQIKVITVNELHKFPDRYIAAGLISSLVVLLWWGLNRKKAALPLPPSPKSDPLIGHLRFLPSVEEHVAYKKWGDELQSDVISLNMMGQIIIVLNSTEAANEILVRRAAIYSDRPQLQMVRNENLTGWGNSTAFLPYGERWRRQRRMSHEVLQKKASEEFWPTVTRQSRRALQRLMNHPKGYEEAFKHMAACTILSSTYGYEVSSSGEELLKIVEAANHGLCQSALAGNFFVNVVPWLRYVPSWLPGAGWKRQAHKWREEKDKMLHLPFNWTREQMAAGTAAPSMLRNLLSDLASQKDSLNAEEEEDRIRWTTGTMFSAGSDTTVAVLLVFVLAMTLHPEVQRKAQMELDTVLGKNRLPELGDRAQLPYIDCIIKEVCRWRSVAPLAIPHKCIKDDYYKGYRIPQGAMVIGNVWAMSNDPEVYIQPEVFNPDRFSDPLLSSAPLFGFEAAPGFIWLRRFFLAQLVQCSRHSIFGPQSSGSV
ncbi:unnamed protein product [Rhizoctonia solani]|uniref:Aldehyde dehydrogenase domain-containing protein n=1 Tax=Rhizoctonia solani TaxID=456999 RepID=A0A8H3AKZ3_9AGAM|nr:unnamed protein product [Rhizoctonia solani]